MHSPSYSPQILQLLCRKVDRDVIGELQSPHTTESPRPHEYTEYLVRTTIETVDFALERPTSCLFPSSSTIPRPFLQLALDVIRRSRIDTPVILVALVYLERARPQFKISDKRCACERILIGALVLAAKVHNRHARFHSFNPLTRISVSVRQYVSDYTIKNARWARWSGTFSKEDIGRMERELLGILDWNLSLAEGDIMAHHEHLLPTTPLSITSLKRPHSPPCASPSLGLELSPFCLPPPLNTTTLTNKTRALTSSVTLPGFSSFLNNPYKHPLASSPSSLQSSLPSILPVTSGEERAYKRPRLVTNPFIPRQPLSLRNKHRHPAAEPLQRSADAQVFKSLRLPLPWSKAFDPFILSYIPPVSFYEPR